MNNPLAAHGDPNEWWLPVGGYTIHRADGEDLLYAGDFGEAEMSYVLDAIKEKYNGGN